MIFIFSSIQVSILLKRIVCDGMTHIHYNPFPVIFLHTGYEDVGRLCYADSSEESDDYLDDNGDDDVEEEDVERKPSGRVKHGNEIITKHDSIIAERKNLKKIQQFTTEFAVGDVAGGDKVSKSTRQISGMLMFVCLVCRFFLGYAEFYSCHNNILTGVRKEELDLKTQGSIPLQLLFVQPILCDIIPVP